MQETRNPKMTSAREGILEGRGRIAATFLFFLCLSVWSWASIGSHSFTYDPIYLGGLVFSIFITGAITYRSPLVADRIVFGAAAGAFSLAAIMMIPLSPTAMLAVKVGKSFMWTVAATFSLIVFVRLPKTSRTK
jgi:hypothetical protein